MIDPISNDVRMVRIYDLKELGLPSIWKENHLNFEKMGGFIFRGTTHIIFMGRSTTGRKERKKNGGIQRGTGITY
ncbi:hypothetical protein VitviT2T_028679 [Vitis vinifera]|uniref:Uncharacterized protein n=1 Tax=Vitis vinifera TaxID=29760 RepID=A0ABY9DUS1_VITVI|nr:hypothetical protein VitviT2T_028679 [Vitis vinifera]